MHWTYGTTWGIPYGIAQGTMRAGWLRSGLTFGTVVWGASPIHLPAMKLAPPLWQYRPALASDDVEEVEYRHPKEALQQAGATQKRSRSTTARSGR